MKKIIISFTVLAVLMIPSQGAVIALDLLGRAGPGLLGGNEAGTVNGTPGTGGEFLGGFSFDDTAKVLTLSFSWTGLQGATAGSVGSATGFHIHGPVTSNPNPFLGNAPVLHDIISNTAGGGAIPNYLIVNNANGTGNVTGTISSIPAGQESDLLAGRWYVNIHSALNGGGEIRGNLVVPEPGTSVVAALALLGLASRRRRH